ncbi:hypothetical protein ACQR3P_29115 [Rhodococcus sp. IEGM1300]
MPTLRSLMSLRERLATKHAIIFSHDPIKHVTSAPSINVDDILEFAEDGVSRLNEIKKALDQLDESPTGEQAIAFHQRVVAVFNQEKQV